MTKNEDTKKMIAELKEYHEQVIIMIDSKDLTYHDLYAHAEELRQIAGCIDNNAPEEILEY